MNIWFQFLADAPATLQRLIARANRISLPRRAPADVRLERLRLALCHAATVRVTYFSMSPDEQAALQQLRACSRGLSHEELTARYGPVRPWSQIAADIEPQSLSEQFILHGFLLPRPATRRHPARFLLPPEVRQWLPRPLALPDYGIASPPPPAPALRLATSLLLAVAERPLPLRMDGQLRVESLRRLAPRLAPLDDADVAVLCRFVVPLLIDLGLLAPHGAAAALSPAGARFLALPPDEQLDRLRSAWVGAPQVDEWLRPHLVDMSGIAWPVLRRRLLAWAAALPTERLLDPAALHAALTDALGPLADAHTHGYRPVDRTPWWPKRAAAVWEGALRGPLTWLGAIAWTENPAPRCFATPIARADLADADDRPPTTDHRQGDKQTRGQGESKAEQSAIYNLQSAIGQSNGPPTTDNWHYGARGEILIPHQALDASVLRLLPYARWHAADAETTIYQISPRRLAAARRDGYSIDALATLLERQAGSLPEDWRAWLNPAPAVQIVYGAVVMSDDPPALDRAAQARSVGRYLTRLAPGIALADPKRVESLTRALGRQDLTVERRGAPEVAQPTDLSAAECATLLAACACYRQHAPDGTAPTSLAQLEDRLRAALPFEQRIAATLTPPAATPGAGQDEGAPPATPGAGLIKGAAPMLALAEDDPPQELEGAESPVAPSRLLAPLLALLLPLWLLLVQPGRRAARCEVAPPAAALPGPSPDAALGTYLPEVNACEEDVASQSPDPTAASTYLPLLRQAIERRRLIEIGYQAAQGASSTRIVRPLLLEGHAGCWYLRAYCTLRRAERLFRVDRITALRELRGTLRRRGRPRRQERTESEVVRARPARVRPTLPRASFFPPPPDPPPGSPLVRVWLAD